MSCDCPCWWNTAFRKCLLMWFKKQIYKRWAPMDKFSSLWSSLCTLRVRHVVVPTLRPVYFISRPPWQYNIYGFVIASKAPCHAAACILLQMVIISSFHPGTCSHPEGQSCMEMKLGREESFSSKPDKYAGMYTVNAWLIASCLIIDSVC